LGAYIDQYAQPTEQMILPENGTLTHALKCPLPLADVVQSLQEKSQPVVLSEGISYALTTLTRKTLVDTCATGYSILNNSFYSPLRLASQTAATIACICASPRTETVHSSSS